MSQLVSQKRVGSVLKDAAAKTRATIQLSGTLAVGDRVRIRSPQPVEGRTSDFIQSVTAIFVDGESRQDAPAHPKGTIQIVVRQQVFKGDDIYLIDITDEPPPSPSPPPTTTPGDGGNGHEDVEKPPRPAPRRKPVRKPIEIEPPEEDDDDDDDGEDGGSSSSSSSDSPPSKDKDRGMGG